MIQHKIIYSAGEVTRDNCRSIYFDREKLKFIGLEVAVIEKLKETYKGIDVEFELGKMSLWLITSPIGKTRKGTMAFIVKWLNNSVPSVVPISPQENDQLEEDWMLTPFMRDHLKELWKGREHILQLNKKKK